MTKYLFFSLLIISCSTGTGKYSAYNCKITLSQEYTIDIMAGSYIPLDTIYSNIYYTIYFDKAKGGKSFFLGKKISEIDPHKEKRLRILYMDQIIGKFSINDLKSIQDSVI